MSKISYYGYTISPNQLETDEGFLICRNVPIARIGDQEYLSSELGLDGNSIITVHRPESEVFSDATIASFEGKPVTDDHPAELVDIQNAGQYSKGHAQNVRRGIGDWSDYLIADLHIHDEVLINEIKAGKREISCGYTVDYDDNGDGTFTQKNIRGNHIAVVEEGRAGHSAAIMDSNKNVNLIEKSERGKMQNNFFANLFGLAAEGKKAEEIAKMMTDTAEALNQPSEEEKPTEENKTTDEDPSAKVLDAIDALGAKIDRLCDALTPKVEEPQDDADPLEEALQKIEAMAKAKAETEPQADADNSAEGIEAGAEEAHVVPAEEMDAEAEKSSGMDAAVKAFINSIKPAIASIKDKDDRKAVADALIKMTADSKNDSQKIMGALAGMKPQGANVANLDEVQKMYDSLNPHKKGDK